MYYFAYGSNLDQQQMKERCSKARFIKRVYLENYEFVYDGYSVYRKWAVANIVAKEGAIVWGALYEITEEDLEKLNKHEGYPASYKREKLIVKDDEGKEYKAWVYLRSPQEKGKSSEEYRNIIIKGARRIGLPENYIDEFIAGKSK